ncbi:hypothetical protein [Vreelandella hamiltonii]|uniref:Uncharacterized protein n=1 Tax=Vreelandella hamiltonii TaxID=502829 RepID=A0A8H9I2I0_9GAMM|nr:hypothetical protein [Halomonas hamiltonii]GGW22994.1 hypothetical protein GCM10007157_12710 [Halomonas hamiltonii]
MSVYGLMSEAVARLESSSFEDIYKEQKQWEENGGCLASPGASAAPIYQWTTWNEELPRLEKAFEEGETIAVLQAVELCALRGLPMPEWCQSAYLKSWRKAKGAKCRTLDEAFGFSMKGVKLRFARQKYLLADVVVFKVLQLLEEGEKGSDAFLAVGKEQGIAWETVRDWYYERRAKFDFMTYSQKRQKD